MNGEVSRAGGTTHSPIGFQLHGDQMTRSSAPFPALPDEIHAHTLEYLSLPEVFFLRGASTHYHDICVDVIKRKYLRDSIIWLNDTTACPHQFQFHRMFGDRISMHVCWVPRKEINDDIEFDPVSAWFEIRQIELIHVAQSKSLESRVHKPWFHLIAHRLRLSLGWENMQSRYLSFWPPNYRSRKYRQHLFWWWNCHDPSIWVAVFPLGVIIKFVCRKIMVDQG
jgi:hypothetical protein